MKERLDKILVTTIQKCFEQGHLKKTPLPDYVIEVPNNANHGHFATNLPMTLASSQRRSPRDIANLIVDHLEDPSQMIAEVAVAGPGFINFSIRREEWADFLAKRPHCAAADYCMNA